MFEPWLGEKYSDESNVLGGRRLVILGESHYSKKPEEIGQTPEGFTPNVIRWLAIRKRHAYFGKLQEIVTREPRRSHSSEGKSAFWNAVAFYNYVPVMVDGRSWAEGGSRRRPSHEMFEAGAAPFKIIRKRLEGEVILVTGLELWGYVWRHLGMPTTGTKSAVIVDDGQAVFTWIRHPSWPGFKPAAYYDQIQTAMDMASEPRERGRVLHRADVASRAPEATSWPLVPSRT